MAFTKKKIDLTFKLGKGAFGESGADVVKLAGHRVQCSIASAGGPSMGQATLKVYGLTLSLMNELSHITRVNGAGGFESRFNSLQIEAGDDAGMAIVFQGQTTAAITDMNGAPEVAMTISAHAGYFEAVKAAAPTSYPGHADAALILANLAADNGYAFENNGVSVMLATPYFPGSPRDQMLRCVEAANICWNGLDDKTLAIWPKGGSRGGLIPLISPDTGMVGYPTCKGIGQIGVKILFNPELRIGGLCQVESLLPFANGKFGIFEIGHQIESETPNGAWFSTFTGSQLNG